MERNRYSTNTLRAVAEFFDDNGIDPSLGLIDIRFDESWGATISVYQHLIQSGESAHQIQVRRLKRLFGPLQEQGKPPYVTLKGGCHITVDGEEEPYELTLDWNGAFACEKIGTTPLLGEELEKKRKEEEQTARYDLSRTFGKSMAIFYQPVEVLYSCKPVASA